MKNSQIVIVSECVAWLREQPDASFDAVVTDPPYGLAPDGRGYTFDEIADGRSRGGFMGHAWDAAVPGETVWKEVLRVLKPGGHVAAFSSTRTYHVMASAADRSGLQIRDMLEWLYGEGNAKGLDVGKAIDKAAGVWRGKSGGVISQNVAMTGGNYSRTPKGDPHTEDAKEWDGWNTALKPSHEPIMLARKPFDGTVAENVLKYGTGALNVGACKFGSEVLPANIQSASKNGFFRGAENSVTPERVGRFPTNAMHDGSDVVVEEFPVGSDQGPSGGWMGDPNTGSYGGFTNTDGRGIKRTRKKDVSGSAARFFYCAKPGAAERAVGIELFCYRRKSHDDAWVRISVEEFSALESENAAARREKRHPPHIIIAGNIHPTVKPVALMLWLVKLLTRPGGRVLDPFCGSGTTGMACAIGGFDFVGIEMNPDYADVARARIKAAQDGRIRVDGCSTEIKPVDPNQLKLF